MKENSHNLEDIAQPQSHDFKSKYDTIIWILFLIGMITSFINVFEGPYQSVINDYIYYKGWEVGLFTPLFLVIVLGFYVQDRPGTGLLPYTFYLITFFAELFYNDGGLILRDQWEIIPIPFILFITSVIGIFVFTILATVELKTWVKNL